MNTSVSCRTALRAAGATVLAAGLTDLTATTAARAGIRDVHVRDLSHTGTHAEPSLFLGYDAEHAIGNVTFENPVINGVVVADPMKKPKWYYTTDEIQWYCKEHVTDLTFLTTAEAEAAAAS